MYKKVILFVILSIIFIIIFFFTCNQIWGDHPLGNNFSLLDGDCREDRIIVYCSNEDRICSGGIYVIPTYERHYNKDGRYAEYVVEAESDKKWIVAKTFQIDEKKEYYWIIDKDFSLDNIDCNIANCDSIIQAHVTGPLNLHDFNNTVRELKIDIDFE